MSKKSIYGFVQNDDPLLQDQETFNARFSDLRGKQLRREYNKNKEYYDPTNLRRRIGISKKQYMQDYLYRTDLATPEIQTRSQYRPKVHVKNSEDIANYLHSTLPNLSFEETRALLNSSKETTEEFLNDNVLGHFTFGTAYKDRNTHKGSYIVYNTQSNAYPMPHMDTTKVHERHHFRSRGSNGGIMSELQRKNKSVEIDDILTKSAKSYKQQPGIDESIPERFYDSHTQYLYSDPEIDARIKQFQFANKLDPKHRYTTKEIESMKTNPWVRWFDLENIKTEHLKRRLNNIF